MVSNLEILLDINNDKKEIHVESKIKFLDDVYELKLILNEGLTLNKVIDDKGNEIIFREEFNINAMFIQSGKRVTLEIPEGTNFITMFYSGKVSGWHNTISYNYIALNFYSAWYPIFENYNMEIRKNVTIKNISDFIVVKGIKCEEDWKYESKDFDCNIIAVKDWNILSREIISPKLNIYFKNSNEEDINYIAEVFTEMINYFTELLALGSDINVTFDIVIPNIDESGYCRDGLIVLNDLPSNNIDKDAFLAHECAHIWARGADVNSWEDWLNETFAEILSLYFIKKQYGIEAYIKRMNNVRKIAEKYPQIKSENGKRPEGVHFKGTYLIHRLSEIFGEDTVIEIAKLFVRLENKTTENLLREVKFKVGENVSKFIEDNLTER